MSKANVGGTPGGVVPALAVPKFMLRGNEDERLPGALWEQRRILEITYLKVSFET